LSRHTNEMLAVYTMLLWWLINDMIYQHQFKNLLVSHDFRDFKFWLSPAEK
jgi:hypothetical protein